MENFTAYNPTALHFGKNIISELPKHAKPYGKKALLMYGKGSSVRNGYYNRVQDELTQGGFEIVEYSGIKPNPIIEDVRKAVELCKAENVDFIVALGGGSVVDSAKIVALSVPENLEPWDVMKYNVRVKKALPLMTVLTLAATGTEMNGAAVVQNHQTGEKIGHVNPLAYPKHSFLDPTFTYTVPANHTAYGIVDLIAHSLEAYFGEGNSTLADRFVISILHEAIEYAPKVLAEPDNYEYRAKIMYAATMALNGTTSGGRKSGDWGVHAFGHELSLLFDIAHGASLSITYPAWLKFMSKRIPERIRQLGADTFGAKSCDETIEHFKAFFSSIKSPIYLQQTGIEKNKRDEIVAQMIKNQTNGMHHSFTDAERAEIVSLMFQ